MKREPRPNPLAWAAPLSALALMAGILLGRAAHSPWPGVLALLPAILAAMVGRGRTRRAACLLAVLCFGCLRGYLAYHPTLPEEGTYTVTGVITDPVRCREDGQVRTVLRQVKLNGRPLLSGAYWTAYPKSIPEGLTPGAKVTVTARLYAPEGAENPGGFDFREYLLQRGVTVGLYGMDELTVNGWSYSPTALLARLRHWLTEGLVKAMGEEAGGYASAMLLGDQNWISDEDWDAFRRLGIVHILAVSGYHVGVLAGVLIQWFERKQLYWQLRLASVALLLTAYCMLTGLHPPVVRASMLVMIHQIAEIRGQQNIGLHLLSVTAIAQLIFSPTLLTGASFQLTYSAMLGLALVPPALERLPGVKDSRFRKLWTALFASIGAQLGILLPQLYWFQELPLLSLPLNLVVLTGAGILMAGYWLVLALLIVPPLAGLVGGAMGLVTRALTAGVRALAGLDGIVLWVRQANFWTGVGWVLLLAGGSILWMKRRRGPLMLGAALLVLSLFSWPRLSARYIQFSVGNADAALLLDRDMVAVVDTGEDGTELANYLRQQRLSVDALFLSHLHSDHAGGIRGLLDEDIPVRTVYLAEGAENADVDNGMLALLEELQATGTQLHHLSRGDTVSLPDGVITAVWPEGEHVREGLDANLYSLVLHVDVHGTTMLLTGDLDGDYERYAAIPVDILKVAHHGSKYSTSEAYLDAVAPKMLILSCGDETRQQLMQERRNGVPLYGTQEHGAVTVDFSGGGYSVHTMH